MGKYLMDQFLGDVIYIGGVHFVTYFQRLSSSHYSFMGSRMSQYKILNFSLQGYIGGHEVPTFQMSNLLKSICLYFEFWAITGSVQYFFQIRLSLLLKSLTVVQVIAI